MIAFYFSNIAKALFFFKAKGFKIYSHKPQQGGSVGESALDDKSAGCIYTGSRQFKNGGAA